MCLYSLKIYSDPIIIEELVSDCFIKLWEGRYRLEIKSSVKHYLFLMLKNSILDFFRKQKIYTEPIENFPELPSEEEFEGERSFAKLYEAIDQLPEQRRRIIEMAVFESMSHQEISERLGISKTTVRTQIGRAYRFFREKLDPEDLFLFFLFKRRSLPF